MYFRSIMGIAYLKITTLPDSNFPTSLTYYYYSNFKPPVTHSFALPSQLFQYNFHLSNHIIPTVISR